MTNSQSKLKLRREQPGYKIASSFEKDGIECSELNRRKMSERSLCIKDTFYAFKLTKVENRYFGDKEYIIECHDLLGNMASMTYANASIECDFECASRKELLSSHEVFNMLAKQVNDLEHD